MNAPERQPTADAVATLKAFLLAMLQRDQKAIEQLTYEHPDRAILWHDTPPPAEILAEAKAQIDSIQFHKVTPGDQILGLDGKPLVVKEGDLKPNQIMLTFAENPIPFFLEQEAGAWRVHATPIITIKRSSLEDAQAEAAAQALLGPDTKPLGPGGQTVQQPAVVPADNLGPPPGVSQLPPGVTPLPPGVQPIAQPNTPPTQPTQPQIGIRPSPPPR
jgi:hypothetical protein